MQNFYKKVNLILRLNYKVKRLNSFIEVNNSPINNSVLMVLQNGNVTKVVNEVNLISKVLINLNYLNY